MAQQIRPPVITIMGHVDHGKTTLLDYIRQTNVVSREAGGITQHIGAYSIEHSGKKLTFIDTPGHAAFNKMRERGSQITDLIVLVVAANDGVKPQTIESIRHIKNANVPFVVAINKTDLKDIDVNIAKSGLAEHDVVVTDYGGDVEAIEISALKGTGVDKLLETLGVMAELAELQADAEAPLRAVVIESSKDSKRGSLASVIVQQGTLKTRQDIYTDEAEGRVKLLTDGTGEQLAEVGPGMAAEVVGFKSVPAVGAIVRDAAQEYPEITPEESPETDEAVEDGAGMDIDIEAFFNETPKLKLIIKADVEGTLEAIMQNLDPDSTEVLASAVGEVTENELELAQTSGATIIAFHLKTKGKIKRLAKDMKVKLKQYDIIYKLIEDLQKLQLKLMDATIDEVTTGEAEILQIFEMRGQTIAGCRVKTGVIKKNDLLHLMRDGEIIADPKIKSMMHGKDEIDEAKAKKEFGAVFSSKKLQFQVGDMLTAYVVEED